MFTCFESLVCDAWTTETLIVGVSPDDPLSYAKAGMLAWAAGRVLSTRSRIYPLRSTHALRLLLIATTIYAWMCTMFRNILLCTEAFETSWVKAGSGVWCEARVGASLSTGTMFESPIDFYKSQWQSQIIKAKQTPGYVPPYKSVGECVAASIRHNGVRGPFQGLGATLTRNLPAGGAVHSHPHSH